MTLIRAFFRAVIVALAVWAGQSILPANRVGIWAMVSLGIAAAILGLLFTHILTHPKSRGTSAAWQFAATAIVLFAFYWLIPKHPLMVGPDMTLVIAIAIISGLSEWFVSDPLANR